MVVVIVGGACVFTILNAFAKTMQQWLVRIACMLQLHESYIIYWYMYTVTPSLISALILVHNNNNYHDCVLLVYSHSYCDGKGDSCIAN